MHARVPEDVGEDTEPARELRALRRLRHTGQAGGSLGERPPWPGGRSP